MFYTTLNDQKYSINAILKPKNDDFRFEFAIFCYDKIESDDSRYLTE